MSAVLAKWINSAEEELKLMSTSMDKIRTDAKIRRETEAFEVDRFEAAVADSSKNVRKRGGASGNEGFMDAGVGSSRNTRIR